MHGYANIFTFALLTSHRKTKNLNVLTDAEIKLTEETSHKKYPSKLRLVRFHDSEQDRDFAFLTNATHLTALEVANLYKNR